MKKKIVFSGLLFCLFGVVLVMFLKRISVTQVECVTQFGACPKEIAELTDKFKGKSYFEAKTALVSALSENSRIEHFRIRFNLPSVLVVELVERKPEVAAKFGENNYFIFDKDGISLGQVSETALPSLTVYGVPSNKSFVFAIKLSRELFSYYGARDVRLENHGLSAKVRGNVEVVFPLGGDLDVVLGALEVSLLQLNEGAGNSTISLASGKNYKVDLRYKNPVISEI